MSLYAGISALHSHWFSEAPLDPGRQSRFSVDLTEFLRPDGAWPARYTLEQTFQTFRRFVETGSGYTSQERWGKVGVKALLSATSANDSTDVDEITSIEDLRKRFHYALLGHARSPAMAQWRKDHRIAPGERIQVRHPVHAPFQGARYLGWSSEAAIRDTLDHMTLKVRGQTLQLPLNYVHLGIRTAQRVKIRVHKAGFWFSLDFGIIDAKGVDDSGWNQTLAWTKDNETFLETLARARDVLHVMLTGEHRDCDASQFLGGLRYTPAWYQQAMTSFFAGERAPIAKPALQMAEV